MSPSLPVVSGQQAVRVFKRLGYEVVVSAAVIFACGICMIQPACR